MLGIALAAVYVGWKYLADSSAPIEPAFLAAAAFLYNWYWWWTLVIGVFAGLLGVAITLGVGAKFAEKGGGVLGAIGGGMLGGAVSLALLASVALRQGLLLVGSHLIAHAGKPTQTFAEFNLRQLAIGGVLLAIGALAFRTSTSTRKSD